MVPKGMIITNYLKYLLVEIEIWGVELSLWWLNSLPEGIRK
jgi:hypothetical protein